MKYKTAGVVVFFSLLLGARAFAQVFISPEEAIKQTFPKYQKYTVETHTADNQKVDVFRVLKGRKLLGWAVVLNEKGLKEPITFLVGIDTAGKVLDVYILEYREPHGFEIREKEFMRQFQGKTIDEPLIVGEDIDAVTHATISSKAATVAVKKALKIIEDLRKHPPHA